MTTIIADMGSCHNGELNKAQELVKIAADCGADACKVQLLEVNELTNTGNIELPWDWLPNLMGLGQAKGIDVFPSVFSTRGVCYAHDTKCDTIKFPYSQQHLAPFLKLVNEDRKEYTANPFKTVYRSCGVMDELKDWAVNLFCIPEYPVPYLINFEGIFPMFDGFSSHCMGIKTDITATVLGAKVLEVHFKGGWESPCPDWKFAKSPHDLESLCKAVK